MMDIALLFILGTSIGSFLNVLIDRLPNEESIRGRSHCDYCKKTIPWYDLIPLVSFVLLQGRCRYCKKRLTYQYPLIEFLTGVVFVYTYSTMVRFMVLEDILILLSQLVIFSGLIVIFFADLKYRIIPDEILIVLLLVTFGIKFFTHSPTLLTDVFSGSVLFLIFLGLVFLTKGRGMGMGDVKYVFFMGLLLGYPSSIVAFYIAFLTGAMVSIILVLRGEKKFGQTIAFGPFLVIATAVAYRWGDVLWVHFQKLIGLG